MVTLSLTTATQVDWVDSAAAKTQSIVSARNAYMESSVTEQKTDGLVTLSYDTVTPYIGWTKWTDSAAANDYIAFITAAATDANVTVTTSIVDITSIPDTGVNYFQF